MDINLNVARSAANLADAMYLPSTPTSIHKHDPSVDEATLCLGPMSKNIVDAIIEVADETRAPFVLIPSRRQIDYDGGYVNNWTTESFAQYVTTASQFISIQRDHAGPLQGARVDDGFTSLSHDARWFDSIHIDPWRHAKTIEQAISQTLEMINFAFKIDPTTRYEVGTEEAITKLSPDDLDQFLCGLMSTASKNVKAQIYATVIQSGTGLSTNKNTGTFDQERLTKMLDVAKNYGLKAKEHNGDFLTPELLEARFSNGLDSINIAPELGVIETKTIINYLNETNPKLIEQVFKICHESRRWCKWAPSSFDPTKHKIKTIEICGHYNFSNPEFIKIKSQIPEIDHHIISQIKKTIVDWRYTIEGTYMQKFVK